MKIIARWLLLGFLLVSLSGCSNQQAPSAQVVLTSSLDKNLVQALLDAYNPQAKLKIRWMDSPKPGTKIDLYLEPVRVLGKETSQLRSWPGSPDQTLPLSFRNRDGLWYGVFYDPVVLLVKHQYARTLGQEKLTTWYDLPQTAQGRLTLENLTDNDATKEFLAAMASHMGETEAIHYFRLLKPRITSYGKAPFTPIRMVTVGDADLAITRRSYVMKYLESDFPAYVLQPLDGSPATLYGLALNKESSRQEAAEKFLTWLLTSPEAQNVLRLQQTGFLPIINATGKPTDSSKIWLNTAYPDEQAQNALADTWLREIRL